MRAELRFVLLLFGLFVGIGGANTQDRALDRAREAYESGNFAAAARAYQEVVDAGVENALLHYNLGNARFKAGELGRAIASYERARRLAPRDERIRTNLDIARAQIRDRELSDHDLPVALVPLHWLYAGLSLNEWWAAALIGFLGLAAISAAGQWRRLPELAVRRGRIALLVVTSVALLMGGLRYGREVARTSAVVVAQRVEVRSGPGADYSLAFLVHEGLKLEVAERRDEWVRVDLGGELVGWVPRTVVETL